MFPPALSRAEETRPSRRSIVVAAPALAAAVLAVGGITSTIAMGIARTKTVDPVFAAITAHEASIAEVYRLGDVLDEAEHGAEKAHGRRPVALIKWRSYVIGGTEIDRVRLFFLREVRRRSSDNSKRVDREYRDAKARYAAAVSAGADWDKRAGITQLRQQFERAKVAQRTAAERLAITRPTTPAGAGALIDYVRADIGDGIYVDWHLVALHTVGEALNKFAVARA
jgi:hypothetical protein